MATIGFGRLAHIHDEPENEFGSKKLPTPYQYGQRKKNISEIINDSSFFSFFNDHAYMVVFFTK